MADDTLESEEMDLESVMERLQTKFPKLSADTVAKLAMREMDNREKKNEDKSKADTNLRGIDPMTALINSHRTEREQWKRKMEEAETRAANKAKKHKEEIEQLKDHFLVVPDRNCDDPREGDCLKSIIAEYVWSFLDGKLDTVILL